MKRIRAYVALFMLVCGGLAFSENAKPSSLTLGVQAGVPTGLSVGWYYPIDETMGAQLGLFAGTGLDYGQMIVNRTKNGEINNTDMFYNPEGGFDCSAGLVLGAYLDVALARFDLPFGKMPVYAGISFLTGGTDQYSAGNIALKAKAELELDGFKLLRPYVELGMGSGRAVPLDDALAASKVAYPDSNFFYWNYTSLNVNVGVRYDLPLGKAKPAKAAEKPAPAKAPPVPMDTRVGRFLFPQWLVKLGGMTYYPDPLKSELILMGVQKMGKSYSFKYQSNIKSGPFNYVFKEDSLVQVIQSDDTVYKAKFRTPEGKEILVELKPFKSGDTISVKGKSVEADQGGVVFNDRVFLSMSMK